MKLRLTATRSPSFVPLPALPSLPAPPVAAYRWPKLLEYRFLVPPPGLSDITPSALVSDLRSPRLDGENGGDGRRGNIGDPGVLDVDGTALAREEVGDVYGGRDGSDGPPDSGEFCLSDGEGECIDGEPEDNVDDLKALIGLTGRRIVTGP